MSLSDLDSRPEREQVWDLVEERFENARPLYAKNEMPELEVKKDVSKSLAWDAVRNIEPDSLSEAREDVLDRLDGVYSRLANEIVDCLSPDLESAPGETVEAKLGEAHRLLQEKGRTTTHKEDSYTVTVKQAYSLAREKVEKFDPGKIARDNMLSPQPSSPNPDTLEERAIKKLEEDHRREEGIGDADKESFRSAIESVLAGDEYNDSEYEFPEYDIPDLDPYDSLTGVLPEPVRGKYMQLMSGIDGYAENRFLETLPAQHGVE